MGLFLWWLAGGTERWLEMGAWHRVGWMSLLVVGGAGVYFGTLYVLGMRLKDLRHQKINLSPPPPGSAA
jgi:putative peptidoglycan lipid II flippase